MTPTQMARRSDALYEDNTGSMTRRVLCDMVAQRESDLEDARAEFEKMDKWHSAELQAAMAENAKLREQVERLQPKDCEGNVLDIADTVHMLRSEYDGDHEWEDVVVELVLAKWGGDRWIVRGSKGEAWACDCTKTGYDEDAYEGSDDVEPIANPTLIEVENAKLRELVRWMYDRMDESCAVQHPYAPAPISYDRLMQALARSRELGVEVDG